MAEVLPVETNIVIVRLVDGITNTDYLAKLNEQGILAVAFGPQLVRFVTHLDLTDDDVTLFEQSVSKLATAA